MDAASDAHAGEDRMGVRVRSGRFPRVVALLVSAVALTPACIVLPVPASRQIVSPSGETTLPDIRLRSGLTRRAEIETALARFMVDVGAPRLCWARYSESGMAVVWLIGGPAGAVGDRYRMWGLHNLFVTFREDGTLGTRRDVGEGELPAVLREYLRAGELQVGDFSRERTLEISPRQTATVQAPATVVLSRTTMVLSRTEVRLEVAGNSDQCYRFAPSRLTEVGVAGDPTDHNPAFVRASFRFTDGRGDKHHWTADIAPEDLPVLIAYFERVSVPEAALKRIKGAQHPLLPIRPSPSADVR